MLSPRCAHCTPSLPSGGDTSPAPLRARRPTNHHRTLGGSRLLCFTFLVHLAAAGLYVCLFHCVESYYQVGKVVEPLSLLTVSPVDEVLKPVLRNE